MRNYYKGDGSSFQFGSTQIYVDYSDGKDSLCSSTNNTVTIGSYNDTLWTDYDIYKLSESAGFYIRSATGDNKGHEYSGSYRLRGFNVSESGKISLNSVFDITGAASSVASADAWKDIDFTNSIADPCNFLFMTTSRANNNTTYSYNTFFVRASNGVTASVQSAVNIGTDYSEIAGKTNVDTITNRFFAPQITFADGKITVGRGAVREYPIWIYGKYIRNSSDSITGGGDYVVIHHGLARGAPSNIQLTTVSGGVTSTLQPWLEDDNNAVAGVWNSKSDNQIYAVTFKKGTYDYSADWYDKYSTVWTFDFLTPRIIKTTTKLSQIIDDLQL